MIEIGYSGGVITPRLVDGYEAKREGRTAIHEIPGRSSPDVTLRPAGSRSGTLVLNFDTDEASADSAASILASPEVFTFSTDELSSIDMSFVVPQSEQIVVTLDDDTREVWLVTVPFREVTP